MEAAMRKAGWFAVVAIVLGLLPTPPRAQSALSSGFAASNDRYTAQERAGREIWMFATAFNDRFFTYSYPQRLGGAIDWYEILAADRRGDLFDAWGAIPDPDCCVPGAPDCPAQSPDQTYGFLWCPGDDELLGFVGREGYPDPACRFEDAPFDISTPHGALDQRQSPCDLRFGTSTGALGLRKFPNPRFDAAAWEAVGGWEGYAAFLSDDPEHPDSRLNRLWDGSIEPPFRIGMACGACHIAYDPANPPADPDNPGWENIEALVGNQYSRISNLLGNGLSPHRLEWQLIARARPGIVDTSALPMDYVSNPGTMNAIINFARRPLFEHRVLKWRKASACEPDADPTACWCEPGRQGKCWERGERTEMVPQILKGGEDSIGYEEAIQRVYFNIGSCAEQCWINHVPDLRAADPASRNYGQTPFDIGQCRRDCASFRAIEDRLADVKAFFLSARPSDLWRARGLASPRDLELALDAEYFPGAVEQGRRVFAANCARCHSSQPGPYDDADFAATDPADPTLRLDWLGNDEVSPVSEIGTYSARALHANHMPSRVWAEYASLDTHERAADPLLAEIMKGAGRGYYRNVSLLSLWAHAPFMHNNAIGPEICGKPEDPELDFYSSPYVDAGGQPLADAPECHPFDTSVEGRYALYKASMDELLNPDRRVPKTFVLDRDIVIDIAPEVEVFGLDLGLTLRIPQGFPAVDVNSLRFKDMIQDLVLVGNDMATFDAKYAGLLTPEQHGELRDGLLAIRAALLETTSLAAVDLVLGRDEPVVGKLQDLTLQVGNDFVQRYYSNVLGHVENAGHRFGEGLSEQDKAALTAFLATM
jgi:mono/diheme cytochrome c family protein